MPSSKAQPVILFLLREIDADNFVLIIDSHVIGSGEPPLGPGQTRHPRDLVAALRTATSGHH